MKVSIETSKKVIGVLLLYIMIHMYYMTNLITNRDDVVLRYNGYYDQTYLGRWLLPYVNKITFYTLNSNWTVGILSAVCYSLGIIIILRIIDMKDDLFFWSAASIMLSFPSMASWNLYAWMGLGFSTGFLLAIAASYIILSTPHYAKSIQKLGRCALSSLLLCCSMACYQAFTSIYIVIIWVFCFYLLCNNDIKKIQVPTFYVLYSIISLAIGYFIYHIVLNYTLKIKKMELTSYQGIGQIGKITFTGIIKGISDSYVNWWKFYFDDAYGIGFLKLLNIIVISFLFISWSIKLMRTGKLLWKKILLLLLILIFPCITNNIYILTLGNSQVYSCMYFTYVFSYLLFLKEIEDMKVSIVRKTVFVMTYIICFIGFMIVNRAYSNQEAILNNLQQYFNRVAIRVESTEGFTTDTKVYYSNPISIEEYTAFEANSLDTTDSLLGMIYSDSGVHSFMQYYCGFQTDNIIANESLQQKILSSETYQQMGIYPAEDSIQFIENVLVVKFK